MTVVTVNLVVHAQIRFANRITRQQNIEVWWTITLNMHMWPFMRLPCFDSITYTGVTGNECMQGHLYHMTGTARKTN